MGIVAIDVGQLLSPIFHNFATTLRIRGDRHHLLNDKPEYRLVSRDITKALPQLIFMYTYMFLSFCHGILWTLVKC